MLFAFYPGLSTCEFNEELINFDPVRVFPTEQKQQSKKTTKQNNTRKRKSVLASELVENPGTREKTRKANITTPKKEGKLKVSGIL